MISLTRVEITSLAAGMFSGSLTRPGPAEWIGDFGAGLAGAAFLLCGLVFARAVLRHQRLDIRPVLSRRAGQWVRFFFVLLTGSVLLLLLAGLAPGQFTFYSLASTWGVLLTAAGVAVFLFPGYGGRNEARFERWILGDRLDYLEHHIQEFIERIPLYTQAALLLDDLHELLVKTMRASRYQIIVRDDFRRFFTVLRAHPPGPAHGIHELNTESPLCHYFLDGKTNFIGATSELHELGETRAERAGRQQLRQLGFAYAFPLIFGDTPFGLLLVGQKSGEDAFSPLDLHGLASLTEHLRPVLNEIRLTQQVRRAEEMELLGRLSPGMAHDLRNHLTTVWTYLQLARENPPTNPAQAELLPKVILHVETIRAYVREAMDLSQHHRPRFKSIRLETLIRNAVALAESRWQPRGISVECDLDSEIMAEIDEVLVQRLIGNFLGNAIDASPRSSVIRLELLSLPAGRSGGERLRLRIIDHGSGISAENLPKIGTPYFTTKDGGKENRNLGLGLAICHRIVDLHGGALTILSEPNRGTIAQIDLPIRQNQVPHNLMTLQS